jgi:hypothetical protein
MRRLLLCLQALLLVGCATDHPHAQSRPAAVAVPAGAAVAALSAQQAPELSRGIRLRTSGSLVAEAWSDDLAAAIALEPGLVPARNNLAQAGARRARRRPQ